MSEPLSHSATVQPSALYVWLVPSEHVLEQPGSWRIRKWDTEPFPEANFALSATTSTAHSNQERQLLDLIQWAEKRFNYSNNSEIGKEHHCAVKLAISKVEAALSSVPSASASKPDDLGARAVSFHEWWDAQSDELFIVPSHAIKGWAWKAWNAALSREHTDIEQSRG